MVFYFALNDFFYHLQLLQILQQLNPLPISLRQKWFSNTFWWDLPPAADCPVFKNI